MTRETLGLRRERQSVEEEQGRKKDRQKGEVTLLPGEDRRRRQRREFM